jgi:hypothetical protein
MATAPQNNEPALTTDPSLLQVLEELERREPIFHRPEFGVSRREFDAMTDPDFWEIGASGRRYSREFVIDTVVERHSRPHDDVWETRDFHCRRLSADTFLVTYTLVQDGSRISRRTSIWRRRDAEWQVVFHQGTLVQG